MQRTCPGAATGCTRQANLGIAPLPGRTSPQNARPPRSSARYMPTRSTRRLLPASCGMPRLGMMVSLFQTPGGAAVAGRRVRPGSALPARLWKSDAFSHRRQRAAAAAGSAQGRWQGVAVPPVRQSRTRRPVSCGSTNVRPRGRRSPGNPRAGLCGQDGRKCLAVVGELLARAGWRAARPADLARLLSLLRGKF